MVQAERKSPLHPFSKGGMLFVLLVWLTGCAQGPDFEKPVLQQDNPYSLATNSTKINPGAKIAGDWYRLFHSSVLDDMIRDALANNPDMESARHALLAAQQELVAISGKELPEITLNTSANRAHMNGSFFFKRVEALDVTGNRFTIGPALAYNLDLFGGVERAIEAQEANILLVEAKALNVYVTLVDQIVVTAFRYASTNHRINIAEKLLEIREKQAHLTDQLEKAGKITHADLLAAWSQVEIVRADLAVLQYQRARLGHALARLSGKNPSEWQRPELSVDIFQIPAELPLSLPSSLVQQRPDILAAEANLHVTSARIGIAEAARLPSIALSGAYSQQAIWSGQLMTPPAGIWSFGGNIATPLFDRGSLAAKADEARENYQQSLSSYRSTVLNAFSEVADALDALTQDRRVFESRQRAAENAAAKRDLFLAQYHAGKIDELAFLSAEQQHQNAKLTETDASIDRFIDIAALFRALGGGWWELTDNPAKLPVSSNSAPEFRHE